MTIINHSLILERVCRFHFGYSEKICNNLTEYDSIQASVQKISTRYNLGSSLVTTLPAIISTTLLSPWSDKYGRKFPILSATFGLILEGIGLTIVSIIRSAPAYFIIVAGIPSGIFGGYLMAISSCYTYVADITSEETRTIKFTILQCFFVLADPIGMELGGIIYKYEGVTAVYGIALSALVMGFFWVLFFVGETRSKESKTNFKVKLRYLFRLDNLKENVRTCIASRPGNVRMQIWLLMLANSVALFCTTGSTAIEFFFANRMYKWDNTTFSTITSALKVAHGICLLVAVPVCSRLFKMSEDIIGLLGIISYAAEFGIKCVAYRQWTYYVGCVVGLIGGTSTVAVNSHLSKLANENELSKIFAVLAFCGALMPVFSNIVFNVVYAQTLHIFLGTSYLMMTVLLMIPAIIFIWISRQTSYSPIDNDTD
ncbi:proton-coupled folate transporter-like isoform X2 [Centruroides sculpturatus]|uniref:proton-coupled folate transporter-like isoform X2 n=1 Tax=Centruroides sculpturatus TaxID=218467 RepID=UPI000C6D73FC|nr:proton-coupled folate transporter-like isoform X2 [Centruroides sculpturatus]XP_023217591.1 proton-coupled folate transporter-like isoform X2 [Centruroides sculpturatus]